MTTVHTENALESSVMDSEGCLACHNQGRAAGAIDSASPGIQCLDVR